MFKLKIINKKSKQQTHGADCKAAIKLIMETLEESEG